MDSLVKDCRAGALNNVPQLTPDEAARHLQNGILGAIGEGFMCTEVPTSNILNMLQFCCALAKAAPSAFENRFSMFMDGMQALSESSWCEDRRVSEAILETVATVAQDRNVKTAMQRSAGIGVTIGNILSNFSDSAHVAGRAVLALSAIVPQERGPPSLAVVKCCDRLTQCLASLKHFSTRGPGAVSATEVTLKAVELVTGAVIGSAEARKRVADCGGYAALLQVAAQEAHARAKASGDMDALSVFSAGSPIGSPMSKSSQKGLSAQSNSFVGGHPSLALSQSTNASVRTIHLPVVRESLRAIGALMASGEASKLLPVVSSARGALEALCTILGTEMGGAVPTGPGALLSADEAAVASAAAGIIEAVREDDSDDLIAELLDDLQGVNVLSAIAARQPRTAHQLQHTLAALVPLAENPGGSKVLSQACVGETLAEAVMALSRQHVEYESHRGSTSRSQVNPATVAWDAARTASAVAETGVGAQHIAQSGAAAAIAHYVATSARLTAGASVASGLASPSSVGPGSPSGLSPPLSHDSAGSASTMRRRYSAESKDSDGEREDGLDTSFINICERIIGATFGGSVEEHFAASAARRLVRALVQKDRNALLAEFVEGRGGLVQGSMETRPSLATPGADGVEALISLTQRGFAKAAVLLAPLACAGGLARASPAKKKGRQRRRSSDRSSSSSGSSGMSLTLDELSDGECDDEAYSACEQALADPAAAAALLRSLCGRGGKLRGKFAHDPIGGSGVCLALGGVLDACAKLKVPIPPEVFNAERAVAAVATMLSQVQPNAERMQRMVEKGADENSPLAVGAAYILSLASALPGGRAGLKSVPLETLAVVRAAAAATDASRFAQRVHGLSAGCQNFVKLVDEVEKEKKDEEKEKKEEKEGEGKKEAEGEKQVAKSGEEEAKGEVSEGAKEKAEEDVLDEKAAEAGPEGKDGEGAASAAGEPPASADTVDPKGADGEGEGDGGVQESARRSTSPRPQWEAAEAAAASEEGAVKFNLELDGDGDGGASPAPRDRTEDGAPPSPSRKGSLELELDKFSRKRSVAAAALSPDDPRRRKSRRWSFGDDEDPLMEGVAKDDLEASLSAASPPPAASAALSRTVVLTPGGEIDIEALERKAAAAAAAAGEAPPSDGEGPSPLGGTGSTRPSGPPSRKESWNRHSAVSAGMDVVAAAVAAAAAASGEGGGGTDAATSLMGVLAASESAVRENLSGEAHSPVTPNARGGSPQTSGGAFPPPGSPARTASPAPVSPTLSLKERMAAARAADSDSGGDAPVVVGSPSGSLAISTPPQEPLDADASRAGSFNRRSPPFHGGALLMDEILSPVEGEGIVATAKDAAAGDAEPTATVEAGKDPTAEEANPSYGPTGDEAIVETATTVLRASQEGPRSRASSPARERSVDRAGRRSFNLSAYRPPPLQLTGQAETPPESPGGAVSNKSAQSPGAKSRTKGKGGGRRSRAATLRSQGPGRHHHHHHHHHHHRDSPAGGVSAHPLSDVSPLSPDLLRALERDSGSAWRQPPQPHRNHSASRRPQSDPDNAHHHHSSEHRHHHHRHPHQKRASRSATPPPHDTHAHSHPHQHGHPHRRQRGSRPHSRARTPPSASRASRSHRPSRRPSHYSAPPRPPPTIKVDVGVSTDPPKPPTPPPTPPSPMTPKVIAAARQESALEAAAQAAAAAAAAVAGAAVASAVSDEVAESVRVAVRAAALAAARTIDPSNATASRALPFILSAHAPADDALRYLKLSPPTNQSAPSQLVSPHPTPAHPVPALPPRPSSSAPESRQSSAGPPVNGTSALLSAVVGAADGPEASAGAALSAAAATSQQSAADTALGRHIDGAAEQSETGGVAAKQAAVASRKPTAMVEMEESDDPDAEDVGGAAVKRGAVASCRPAAIMEMGETDDDDDVGAPAAADRPGDGTKEQSASLTPDADVPHEELDGAVVTGAEVGPGKSDAPQASPDTLFRTAAAALAADRPSHLGHLQLSPSQPRSIPQLLEHLRAATAADQAAAERDALRDRKVEGLVKARARARLAAAQATDASLNSPAAAAAAAAARTRQRAALQPVAPAGASTDRSTTPPRSAMPRAGVAVDGTPRPSGHDAVAASSNSLESAWGGLVASMWTGPTAPPTPRTAPGCGKESREARLQDVDSIAQPTHSAGVSADGISILPQQQQWNGSAYTSPGGAPTSTPHWGAVAASEQWYAALLSRQRELDALTAQLQSQRDELVSKESLLAERAEALELRAGEIEDLLQSASVVAEGADGGRMGDAGVVSEEGSTSFPPRGGDAGGDTTRRASMADAGTTTADLVDVKQPALSALVSGEDGAAGVASSLSPLVVGGGSGLHEVRRTFSHTLPDSPPSNADVGARWVGAEVAKGEQPHEAAPSSVVDAAGTLIQSRVADPSLLEAARPVLFAFSQWADELAAADAAVSARERATSQREAAVEAAAASWLAASQRARSASRVVHAGSRAGVGGSTGAEGSPRSPRGTQPGSPSQRGSLHDARSASQRSPWKTGAANLWKPGTACSAEDFVFGFGDAHTNVRVGGSRGSGGSSAADTLGGVAARGGRGVREGQYSDGVSVGSISLVDDPAASAAQAAAFEAAASTAAAAAEYSSYLREGDDAMDALRAVVSALAPASVSAGPEEGSGAQNDVPTKLELLLGTRGPVGDRERKLAAAQRDALRSAEWLSRVALSRLASDSMPPGSSLRGAVGGAAFTQGEDVVLAAAPVEVVEAVAAALRSDREASDARAAAAAAGASPLCRMALDVAGRLALGSDESTSGADVGAILNTLSYSDLREALAEAVAWWGSLHANVLAHSAAALSARADAAHRAVDAVQRWVSTDVQAAQLLASTPAEPSVGSPSKVRSPASSRAQSPAAFTHASPSRPPRGVAPQVTAQLNALKTAPMPAVDGGVHIDAATFLASDELPSPRLTSGATQPLTPPSGPRGGVSPTPAGVDHPGLLRSTGSPAPPAHLDSQTRGAGAHVRSPFMDALAAMSGSPHGSVRSALSRKGTMLGRDRSGTESRKVRVVG